MTTMAEAADQHRATAAHFSALVAGVQDWDAPTPVKEWRARDVVGHLCEWVPGFLQAGSALQVTPGPSPEQDPAGAWAHLRDELQAIMDDPANAELVYQSEMLGTMPLAQVLSNFYVADVFMHSWDLARGTGQDDTLDQPTVAAMFQGMSQMEEMLRGSGQFGTRQPVRDGASVQEQFIAFIGRDPYWQPPQG